MSIDIDWSKAPEGATHCNARDTGSKWWMQDGQCMYERKDSMWRERLIWPNSLIPRPTKPQAPEWDGEGLPPVGCECEMLVAGWEKVFIVGPNSKGKLICEVLASGVHIPCDDPEVFRPIRTKEQRERDELISVLSRNWLNSDMDELADAIIAAGWTKP